MLKFLTLLLVIFVVSYVVVTCGIFLLMKISPRFARYLGQRDGDSRE